MKRQKESIPKKLFFVTKALIDGFDHDEVNFNQESLTVAEIIVHNATKRTMKKDQKLVRRHIENVRKHKTPLLTYGNLEIYSTCRL